MKAMKIAILGFGVEGKSVYKFFERSSPGVEIAVFDEKNGDDFSKIDYSRYDYVFRSPSVAPDKLPKDLTFNHKRDSIDSQPAPATGKLTSATEWFFENCPAKIIGVTGTKGKGTVCSLIDKVLQEAIEGSRGRGMPRPRKTWLVGNIGLPALDVLDKISPEDIVIYELSSFQLWRLQKSPQIAVVLTIADATHLDVHQDFTDYVAAKGNIARWQTANDLTVFYANNERAQEIAELSVGSKIGYPDKRFAHISAAREGNERAFFWAEQQICSTTELRLPGEHNLENALAAISAVWQLLSADFNLLDAEKDEAIRRGLARFKGLPHRLELVRELNGVKYYDDSFSTAQPSVEVAVRAFPDNPLVLVAGGFDQGLNNQKEIAGAILAAPKLKQVVLIGQTAAKIAPFLPAELHKIAASLKEAVEIARATATPGDVVLLSPGAQSFDMFESYKDRGDQFQELVHNLG